MKIETPSDRITAALEYARVAHGTQVRKSTHIPYLSHLLNVGGLVMQFGSGDAPVEEDLVAAGFLHDVLEDCGASHEGPIRAEFGDRVAGIVLNCTDGIGDASGAKPPWRERKRAYVEHLRECDSDTLLVSACDKLDNARAIVADLRAGHDVFARFNPDAGKDGTLWYYGALLDMFSGVVPDALNREFAATVSMMRSLAQ